MSDRARRRLADLFWHGLTALAFAVVVALMFVKPVHAAPAAAPAHGARELPRRDA